MNEEKAARERGSESARGKGKSKREGTTIYHIYRHLEAISIPPPKKEKQSKQVRAIFIDTCVCVCVRVCLCVCINMLVYPKYAYVCMYV